MCRSASCVNSAVAGWCICCAVDSAASAQVRPLMPPPQRVSECAARGAGPGGMGWQVHILAVGMRHRRRGRATINTKQHIWGRLEEAVVRVPDVGGSTCSTRSQSPRAHTWRAAPPAQLPRAERHRSVRQTDFRANSAWADASSVRVACASISTIGSVSISIGSVSRSATVRPVNRSRWSSGNPAA